MTTTLRDAVPADLDTLLSLMVRLYDEDGTGPFDPVRHRRALGELLASPGAGRAWVFEAEGVVVGYLVVTWGFSLEHGGRDAFIDELYVAPTHRRQGLGSRALEAAEAACRAHGVRAVHLEVERANERAQALYRRAGFHDRDRHLLTKRLWEP